MTPEKAAEAQRTDIVFVINFNKDFAETMVAYPTRARAVEQVAIDLGYDGDAELDSAEFWFELQEFYEAGDWKGLNVCEMNTRTLEVTPIERPELGSDFTP